jgi:hypothetical protein
MLLITKTSILTVRDIHKTLGANEHEACHGIGINQIESTGLSYVKYQLFLQYDTEKQRNKIYNKISRRMRWGFKRCKVK